MSQTTRRGLTALLGLAGFAALIAADELVLRALFGTHYLSWYLANGAIVSLLVAFVTLAWGDLNDVPGLISAHPLQYAAAHVALCVLPSQSLAAILAPRRRDRPETAPIGLPVVDAILTVAVTIVLLAAFVAFILVVAPIQYFVYLVAGAPGREAYASPERAWYRIGAREILVESGPRTDELPAGADESAYTGRPVTFTAAIASALLFATQQVVA
jgi:hypothetical protein